MENKKTLLRQPYAVTLAKHRLNTHEMRIMFRIIEGLQPEMGYNRGRAEVGETLFGNKILRIQTKSLLPEGSQNYSSVKRAIATLRERTITIQGQDPKDGKYTAYTGYIVKGKYHHNNEVVVLEIDKEILPCFLALAKNYSKYLLEVAFNSSSSNIMKLYQFISHWKDKKEIEVTVDTLREWLQLEEKYKRSNDIKKMILNPASKELKKKADVYFEIKEPIKQGRKVTGWRFRIFRKATTEKEVKHSQNLLSTIKIHLEDQFKFKSNDFEKLAPLFENYELLRHLWDTILRVEKRIVAEGKEPVKKKKEYMLKALLEELKNLT